MVSGLARMVRSVACETCWGSELQGKCVALKSGCIGKFPNCFGAKNFKTKFCENCCNGMRVSCATVFVLGDGLLQKLTNRRAEGIWSVTKFHNELVRYRVINNTKGCVGPKVVIFKEVPLELDFTPLPEGWVSADGFVNVCVSKGTIVPMTAVGNSFTRVREIATEIPVPATVLVPSAVMCIDDTLEGRADPRDKPLRNSSRLIRNRESAAKTRKRKIEHIYNLESQIENLTMVVSGLREENTFLKFLNLKPSESIAETMEL